MRFLTLALSTVLAAGSVGWAGEPAQPEPSPPTVVATADSAAARDEGKPAHVLLAERIGKPARAGDVLAALAELDQGDIGASRTLVRILGRAGGAAAANGLTSLLGSRHQVVRLEALRAAAEVGQRHPALLARIRVLVHDDNYPRVAQYACEALGALGNGIDMPLLLGFAASGDDRRMRKAAFSALRALTGVRVPNIHARWKDWWEQRHTRGREAVRAAIEFLENGDGERTDLKRHGIALVSDAWIEFPIVRKAVSEWLYADDNDLRGIACEIVGAWRLTEFSEAVQATAQANWAGDGVEHRELIRAAEKALTLLGVPSK